MLLLLIAVGAAADRRKAPDFKLDNWDGRTITLKGLRGKVVVLTFSYAFCSVRCPIITGRLKGLDKGLDSPGDVLYLHVSVDPGMDTPERRKDYFGLYGITPEKDGRWLFLSGPVGELSRLWDFYGVEIRKVEDSTIPEGYYIEYTPKVVIINKEGEIEEETNFFFSEEAVAAMIRNLSGG